MSYVYVYIYTLYTGAKVCVYVYAVSGNERRAYSSGAGTESVAVYTDDLEARESVVRANVTPG